MPAKTLELRTLRPEDEASFKNAVDEFARDAPPWQFAFGLERSSSFPHYLELLEAQRRGLDLPAGFVANTFFVGVLEGSIVGRLSLRHTLNEHLAKIGGHIGYGVIPSQRRRGYATAMLRQAVPFCAALSLDRALVTCDEDNIGSRKVIEACGGLFESTIDCPQSGIPKRRYWIQTTAAKV